MINKSVQYDVGNTKKVLIVTLPYHSFRERTRLIKEHENEYKIEVQKGFLYMEKRKEERI